MEAPHRHAAPAIAISHRDDTLQRLLPRRSLDVNSHRHRFNVHQLSPAIDQHSQSANGHRLRILVIEDDQDSLANLLDILEIDGHEVHGVDSLQKALAVPNPDGYAITLTDRKLPDGMVEDFLPQLTARMPQSEFVVFTGFGDVDSTIAAFRGGASDYVIKPIIPDDLRGTVRRIAERRQLQSAFDKEHAFAEMILNTAEAIVLVLDPEGTILQFNPYLTQTTGWSAEELKGTNWFQQCIPPAQQDVARSIFAPTTRPANGPETVTEVACKNGKHIHVRWSNTAILDAGSKTQSILAVGVDISDLIDAQQQALQAQRLAAIGQTMTGLAHESRNALQRIMAATDMLELEIEKDSHAMQDLDAIRRAGNDLTCLLDEVRSFAAPIHLQRHDESLPSVWQRVWTDLKLQRNNRDATLREPADCDQCPKVHIDVFRMEQVIRNLIENALAACPDPFELQIQWQVEDEFVVLTLRDNGPGIGLDHQHKIFEPFYTTKSTGTGLGLAICQRIIEAHGGTIRENSPAADQPASGACFEIRLPVKANPRALSESSAS